MRATTQRPGAKLRSIRQAESEYGLPAGMLRDLVCRGDIAAVRPPNVRRVFILRAELERKLDSWREVVR